MSEERVFKYGPDLWQWMTESEWLDAHPEHEDGHCFAGKVGHMFRCECAC